VDITVIVIAYNEEANIADCLKSLSVQAYTKGRFEVVVVDGLSQDATPDIARSFASRHDTIRLVINPGRTVSSNRNAGIREARYPYIAFTDADCICPPDWLERLSDGFLACERDGFKVGAVGGGNVSDEQFGDVSAAIGVAFDTPLSALGSQQTRVWSKRKEVESLAGLNVMYAKAVFDDVGWFDETQTNTAEDWIFNYYVRERGYRLFYVPNATVLHKMRTTVPKFVKQMYRYGLGRGTVIRRNPKTLTVRYFMPIMFLLVMALSLGLFAFTGQAVWLLPYLYFPFVLLFTLGLCSAKRAIGLFPLVSAVFFIIHFAYSSGEIVGLLRGK